MTDHPPCSRGDVALCAIQGVTTEIDPADETCSGCGAVVPEFYGQVQRRAIEAHACGDWDAERACLDWLHLHDFAHRENGPRA